MIPVIKKLGKLLMKQWFVRGMFLFVALSGLGVDFSQVYGQTFPCDGKMYFYRRSGGQNYLAYIDNYFTSSPVVNNVCVVTTSNHNALGANPVDSFLYYLNLNNSGLYRLDAGCVSTLMCPNLVWADNGCFDHLGRYWVIDNSDNLMAFDINTCTMVKGPFFISNHIGRDLTYSMRDCHLYMGNANSVVEIDTVGNVIGTYTPGLGAAVGNYGGIAMGSDGHLYGMPQDNITGRLHRFNTVTNTSDGLIYSFVDGTMIPQSCGCDMASFPCPDLEASFTVDSISACSFPFTVNFSSTTEGLISTFIWDFGDGTLDSVNLNPSHTYTSMGVFNATLLVMSNSQCLTIPSDSFALNISIVSPSGAGSTTDTTVCSGDSATISAFGGVQYQWTSSGNISCPSCQSQSVNPISTTEYWVTITDSNGCQTLDTAIVNIFSPNPGSAGPDFTICTGDSVMLNASGGVGYVWSPDSTLNNPNSQNPIASPSITSSYTVIITDTNGCSTSDVLLVNVVSVVIADAGLNATICNGDSVVLQASGGGTYLWSPALGLSDSTVANPIASPVVSTTYFVVASAGSCNDQDSVTITVLPLPNVSAYPDTVICLGDSVTLTANGALSYQWSNGETSQSIIVAPSSSLTYSVTGTDSLGCINYANAEIIVQFPPQVDIGGDVVICIGDTITLTAAGGVLYIWSTGDSGVSLDVSPNSLEIFYVVGYDSVGCWNTDTVRVDVSQIPQAVLNSSGSGGCTPFNLVFSGSSSPLDSTIDFYWDFGDPISGALNYDSVANPSHAYLQGGLFIVTLTISDSICDGAIEMTDTVEIEVLQGPIAGLSYSPGDPSIFNPIVTFTDNSIGSTGCILLTGTGDTLIPCDNSFTYPDVGDYTVTQIVYDNQGCSDTNFIVISILPDYILFAPNTFTPNGDGTNDYFLPKGFGIKEYELFIYNRWGDEIFYSGDIIVGWDGKANKGEDVAQNEVYVYLINTTDYLDEKHLYVGKIILLR